MATPRRRAATRLRPGQAHERPRSNEGPLGARGRGSAPRDVRRRQGRPSGGDRSVADDRPEQAHLTKNPLNIAISASDRRPSWRPPGAHLAARCRTRAPRPGTASRKVARVDRGDGRTQRVFRPSALIAERRAGMTMIAASTVDVTKIVNWSGPAKRGEEQLHDWPQRGRTERADGSRAGRAAARRSGPMAVR